jgi:hypothetical protein
LTQILRRGNGERSTARNKKNNVQRAPQHTCTASIGVPAISSAAAAARIMQHTILNEQRAPQHTCTASIGVPAIGSAAAAARIMQHTISNEQHAKQRTCTAPSIGGATPRNMQRTTCCNAQRLAPHE